MTEGNCRITASLKNQNELLDSIESKNFLVSRYINVTATINKKSFVPGDTISINGKAIKINGKPVDEGTAFIKLGDEGYSEDIKKGAFDFETVLKKTFPSGRHNITIEVKDNDENTGTATAEIIMAAIPTSITISVNNETFAPGDTISSYAILYDQSGEKINAQVSVILYNSWGVDVATKMINNSGQTLEYTFDQKSAVGDWWVYAYSEGLRLRKYISVKKTDMIDADVSNNTLKITNTGNIVFENPVEIIFQSGNSTKTEIKEMNLGIENGKEYELTGADGIYNITIKSGNYEKSFSNVWLTGGVVGASESTKGKAIQNIIAIIIILSVISGAIMLKLKKEKEKPITIRKITIKGKF